MVSSRALWCWIIGIALFQAPVVGQQLCLEPSPGFHVDGVTMDGSATGRITGIAGFNDGNGPAIFVSGIDLFSAGAVETQSLAKWDGVQWIDTGVTSNVDVMIVYAGDLYFATGTAPRLSRWNGAGLSPMAAQPNGAIYSFDVLDLGTGPELYISGAFTQIGALPAPGIARWNGSSWSAVPNGAAVRGPFEAYDDGSGLKLFGISYSAGTCCTCDPFVVRLDGGSWTSIGVLTHFTGCTYANDLQVHDDGTGSKLYVAGRFRTAGPANVFNMAVWDGSNWSGVGGGIHEGDLDQGVSLLATFDDGSGTALYAAGNITASSVHGGALGESYGIVRWNGASWVPVGGSGLGHGRWFSISSPTDVQALGMYDDGGGLVLLAAGTFQSAGSAGAWGVAGWNGVAWSGFGASGQGTGTVLCLKYVDDGSGPALYAGGAFAAAGTVHANNIARWTGAGWSALGTGTNGAVRDVEVFDDGSGLALYIAGNFTRAEGIDTAGMARWNGAQWSVIGTTLNSAVNDLLPHGPLLYAGLSSSGMRAWNGTAWSTPGGVVNGPVQSLALFEGSIYATGQFTQAGPVAVSGIARYSESSGAWSSAGLAVPGGGQDFAVHDDGGGSALYLVASGVVRRLRGGVWSTMPDPGASIAKLEAVDFGLGRASLVAFGTSFGGGAAPIKLWTGAGWLDLTSDVVNGGAYTIAAVPGTSSCAPDLFVGGSFTKWGGLLSYHIAKLTLCGEPGVGFCFGDGSLTTPCPCVPPNTVPNPSGASGHGCANSFHLEGAKMCAVGTTNPDTVTLRVSGLTPIGFTQFFKGNAQDAAGVAFADGVRCVDGTIFRFGGQNAVLGTAYYPNPSLGLNTPISNGGTPPGSGAVGYYQAIYRNATPNFCTIDTLNITNAVQILWN